MRVAIHQPNFLPRLKTVAKILTCDRLIVLDNVQFALAEWQNRARIHPLRPNATKDWFWLTLPLHRPLGQATLINQCRLVDPAACKKDALRSLRVAFGGSPWWSEIDRYVNSPIASAASFPAVATDTMIAAARSLGWQGEVSYSSRVSTRQGRDARLLDLCVWTGATSYVVGSGGCRYIDPRPFRQASIDVEFCQLDPTSLPCRLPADSSYVSFLARTGRSALGNILRNSTIVATQ